MEITKLPFGAMPDGRNVPLYKLVNENGMAVTITPYGGTIVSLTAPDRNGVMDDVVLGFDTLDEYFRRSPFFGCLVGRYANRIANGKFTLDGVEYVLAQNGGPHHLHGGMQGFDKRLWEARARERGKGPSLQLRYVSADGEEGYPGELKVQVTYTLTNDNALRIRYSARTDKPTIVNLTNHSYFNLSAGASDTILGHEMMIAAASFTPADEMLIPTGELRAVAGTALDFRTPTVIGARINSDDEQIKRGGGYDHNWVIDGQGGKLRLAACVHEPITGRVMEVYTTEPAMQFYSGNFLPQRLEGKAGRVYPWRAGLCLETQHYPDSPNHREFPTAVLRPGKKFRSTTVYKFSAE